MSLPSTEGLKQLQKRVTSGEWYHREDDWGDHYVGNRAGHAMSLHGEQVLFKLESGHQHHDTALVALAPELLAEVIRLHSEVGFYSRHLRDMAEKDTRLTDGELIKVIASCLDKILEGDKP